MPGCFVSDLTVLMIDLPLINYSYCKGLLSQQGVESVPTTLSGKLLLLTGFTFGLLVFNSFNAIIVTTLTSSTSIRDINELIKFDAIKKFPSYFVPFQMMISQSAVTEVEQLWSRIKADNESRPCHDAADECDNKILDLIFNKGEPMSFVGPVSYIYNPFYFRYSKDAMCQSTHFHVPITEQQKGLGIRKGLPSKDRINNALLRMRESGVLQRVLKKTHPQKPDCHSYQTVAYKEVSLNHVYGAYLLLLSGYLVAGLIFLGELLTKDLAGQKENAKSSRASNLATPMGVQERKQEFRVAPFVQYL